MNRFRDMSGNPVPLPRLVRNAPLAITLGAARVLLGYRPQWPWLAYSGFRYLRKHLRPEARVLEYGSGQSTIWFAKHCSFIVSREADPDWFRRLEAELASAGLTAKTRYELHSDAEGFAGLSRADIEIGFDMILVDGAWRDVCVSAALPALRPGGILYLDNSDRGGPAPDLLLAFAAKDGCDVTRFTDFAVGGLHAQQGMAIRRTARLSR